jgi:hypothetical protein
MRKEKNMLDVNGANKNEFLEYKGRPLVRQGDDICYGDMSDKFYIYMVIMNEVDTEHGTVPSTIMVQLLDSNTKLPKEQKILNGINSMKDAFEFADAWLERYNR